MSHDRILLGKIGAAHGIRGEVRITSFTGDPLAIARYGALETDRPGLSITIAEARAGRNVVVARIEGVTDRNGAEALNGISLYTSRENLDPPGEDEFYHADLIGLEARLADGEELGTIVAVPDFGADDLLEIRLRNTRRTVYLPFTKSVVPVVDIARGFVTVHPPQGWLEETPRDPDDREESP